MLDIQKELKASFSQIMEHIAQLSLTLRESTVDERSVVFVLPPLKEEDIGVKEDITIDVTPLYGSDAFEKYLLHIADMHIKDGHPGLMAKRLPGCIVLKHSDPKDIENRISIINQKKDEFKALIKQSGDNNDERFAIVSTTLPWLIRLAAERHLLCSGTYGRDLSLSMAQKTLYVGFSWVKNSFSASKKYNKSHWEDVLHNKIAYARGNSLIGPDEHSLQIDLDTLNNASGQIFRTLRPKRVHPATKVNFLNEQGISKWTTVPAHSPLLFVRQAPKSIGKFKTYNGPAIGSRKQTPVIQSLNLYEVS